MTDSTTVSLTVKLAWPLALVVPLTVVMVELPLPTASETALPLTGPDRISVPVVVTVASATAFTVKV